MTLKNLGSLVSVRVGRHEVNAFALTWPCCNLPDRSITFHFDTKTGDLVELFGVVAPSLCCGELEALAESAKQFARKEIEKHYASPNPEPHQN